MYHLSSISTLHTLLPHFDRYEGVEDICVCASPDAFRCLAGVCNRHYRTKYTYLYKIETAESPCSTSFSDEWITHEKRYRRPVQVRLVGRIPAWVAISCKYICEKYYIDAESYSKEEMIGICTEVFKKMYELYIEYLV